jgi:hypothetical protein
MEIVLGVHIKEIVQTQYIRINMTEQEILKFGEIQYLKGRLDELYKAIPTVTNMERRRKLDQRIEKYITKLKKVDEVAYRLYEVELNATHRVKVKGKLETENLFKEILLTEQITDETIIKKIKDKLETL